MVGSVVFALILIAPQKATFEAGKTATVVQAEMVSRYFQVEAEINGKPAKLIVDTGAGLNVLTPEAAKRLGIEGGFPIAAQGAGSKRTPAKLVKVDTFRVGGATVSGESAVVIPLPEALQCDGLVGYSFLRHFATTFDYAKAQLTFTDPKAFRKPAQAIETELKIVQNHPRVTGTVDGESGWLTLDTGANGTITVMTPTVAKAKMLDRYKVGRPRITGKGVGGFAYGHTVRLNQFEIAGIALPGSPTNLSTQTDGAFATSDTIANVGAEILNRFVFTLDYGAKKAYFTKASTFERPFLIDRSGAWIDFVEGSYKLAGVSEGSPAETAGLLEGDQIVEIDGKSLATVRPLEVSRPLQAPAGTKVKITYRRDGKAATVELTLRDLF